MTAAVKEVIQARKMGFAAIAGAVQALRMWQALKPAGAALALGLTLTAGTAQEVEVLSPIAQHLDAGADPAGFVSRCGGFYLSVYEWLGSARLGEATSERIRQSVGAIIRHEAGTTHADLAEDEALAAAEAVLRGHSDAYLKYFSALYVDTPEGFTNDPLMRADNASCQTVLGSMGQ